MDARIETALKLIDSLLKYNDSASKNATKMISCSTIDRELRDIRKVLMEADNA
jgi:regulator of sigma D